MRHIKIKLELPQREAPTHFSATVVEQTHFYEEFGTGFSYRARKFIHGTVCLISHVCSQFKLEKHIIEDWAGPNSGVEICLFLLGHAAWHKDYPNKTVENIPINYAAAVKAAIEAYNEAYKD